MILVRSFALFSKVRIEGPGIDAINFNSTLRLKPVYWIAERIYFNMYLFVVLFTLFNAMYRCIPIDFTVAVMC